MLFGPPDHCAQRIRTQPQRPHHCAAALARRPLSPTLALLRTDTNARKNPAPHARARAPMAATGVASAAVLVYLVLSGRLRGDASGDGDARGREDEVISSAVAAARRRRKEEARARREQRRPHKGLWPERAPTGWREAAAVAARTGRFTWA
jgi:hypothetical protein